LKEYKDLEAKLKKQNGSEKNDELDEIDLIHKPSSNIFVKIFTIIRYGLWNYFMKNKLFTIIISVIIIIAIRKRLQTKIVDLINFIFFNK